MPVAQLGNFQFHAWNGGENSPYLLLRSHPLTDTRAGLNGANYWDIGSWGDPFEVDTVTLVNTYYNARVLQIAYHNTKGESGLSLTGDIAQSFYRFKVLDVKAKARAIVRGHVAGDPTDYYARVDAHWTLAAYSSTE